MNKIAKVIFYLCLKHSDTLVTPLSLRVEIVMTLISTLAVSRTSREELGPLFWCEVLGAVPVLLESDGENADLDESHTN